MSVENLEQFYQFLNQHPELREQLNQFSDQESFIQGMIQLGADNGYDFTAEELESVLAATQLPEGGFLSDEDLELVSGGLKQTGLSEGASGTVCGDSRFLDPFCGPTPSPSPTPKSACGSTRFLDPFCT